MSGALSRMVDTFLLIFIVSIAAFAMLERSLMYKIKDRNLNLYRNILGDSAHSWIEMKGWYLPSHVPVSCRLLKTVVARIDPRIISRSIKTIYLTLLSIWMISLGCFVLFGAFSLVAKL